MKPTIRSERPEEFAVLHDFIREAFCTAAVADGDEQNFADRLRTRANYRPQLALVAELDSRIVGHIMLTTIRLSDGREILIAAPLCVRLENRSQGIGGALLREAFTRAEKAGYGAVILVGDPAYYSRFGFRPAEEFGITNTDEIPGQYVQLCELLPGAMEHKPCTVSFHGM